MGPNFRKKSIQLSQRSLALEQVTKLMGVRLFKCSFSSMDSTLTCHHHSGSLSTSMTRHFFHTIRLAEWLSCLSRRQTNQVGASSTLAR